LRGCLAGRPLLVDASTMMMAGRGSESEAGAAQEASRAERSKEESEGGDRLSDLPGQGRNGSLD